MYYTNSFLIVLTNGFKNKIFSFFLLLLSLFLMFSWGLWPAQFFFSALFAFTVVFIYVCLFVFYHSAIGSESLILFEEGQLWWKRSCRGRTPSGSLTSFCRETLERSKVLMDSSRGGGLDFKNDWSRVASLYAKRGATARRVNLKNSGGLCHSLQGWEEPAPEESKSVQSLPFLLRYNHI